MVKKRNKNSQWKKYASMCVSIFLLVVIVRWGLGNYQSHQQAKGMLQEASSKLEKLQTRKDVISERNDLLETETGVQDFLIEKYAVKRAGERVLVLIQDDSLEEEIQEKPEKSFWQKMNSLFFE